MITHNAAKLNARSYTTPHGGRKVLTKASSDEVKENSSSRREMLLKSINGLSLASLFTIGATARPRNIGIQDFGNGIKSLSLCPSTPNCIATSEAANDPYHYVPALVYNPEDGRGRTNPVTQEQAMQELVEVFIDDVEFWFPPDRKNILEYRSASRIGESDGDINRKRIKAIRLELQKKGWVSSGF